MGFIYGMKHKYSGKSAENLFPYILAMGLFQAFDDKLDLISV